MITNTFIMSHKSPIHLPKTTDFNKRHTYGHHNGNDDDHHNGNDVTNTYDNPKKPGLVRINHCTRTHLEIFFYGDSGDAYRQLLIRDFLTVEARKSMGLEDLKTFTYTRVFNRDQITAFLAYHKFDSDEKYDLSQIIKQNPL